MNPHRVLIIIAAVCLTHCMARAAERTTPDVPTEALGYFNLEALGATDNKFSIPFARPAVAHGFVSDVDGDAIYFSTTDPLGQAGSTNPSWTDGQFEYNGTSQRETYYVEFTAPPSGRYEFIILPPTIVPVYTFAGKRYKVTTNGTDVGTGRKWVHMETEGEDISDHPRFGRVFLGDAVVIRPYWRIKDVFEYAGTPRIESRPNAFTLKDDILIQDYSTVGINKSAVLVIYHQTSVGWRAAGQGSTDYSDFILPPHQAVIFRRRNAASLTIPVAGGIAAYDSALLVPGGDGTNKNDTTTSLFYPLPLKLRDSNLRLSDQSITPIKDTAISIVPTDEVLTWASNQTGFNLAPGPTFRYLKNATSDWWHQVGLTGDQGDYEIEPGRAFITRKGAANASVDWIMPVKRTELRGPKGTASFTGSTQATFSWPTVTGLQYQLQQSTDLDEWTNVGSLVTSAGSPVTHVTSTAGTATFFRLESRAIRSGFADGEIEDGDDFSSELVDLGFPVVMGDVNTSEIWVNNNGNLSFDLSFATHTPSDPVATYPIIAPFWANMDTRCQNTSRPDDSRTVTFGKGFVGDRRAFGVNYVDVGYYGGSISHTDKMNSLQVILIESTTPGDFDIEFNYNRVLWESGDFFGGSSGFGGDSARVGFSDGSALAFEINGSAVNGALLDSHATLSLAKHSLGSSVTGRYVFQIRGGKLFGGLNVDAGIGATLPPGTTSISLAGSASDPASGTLTYEWTQVQGTGLDITNAANLSTTATWFGGGAIAPGAYKFRLKVNRTTGNKELASDEVTFIVQ
jgi:uncharacterized protein (TIGR02597 family)